jgi:hypothetical protein
MAKFSPAVEDALGRIFEAVKTNDPVLESLLRRFGKVAKREPEAWNVAVDMLKSAPRDLYPDRLFNFQVGDKAEGLAQEVMSNTGLGYRFEQAGENLRPGTIPRTMDEIWKPSGYEGSVRKPRADLEKVAARGQKLLYTVPASSEGVARLTPDQLKVFAAHMIDPSKNSKGYNWVRQQATLAWKDKMSRIKTLKTLQDPNAPIESLYGKQAPMTREEAKQMDPRDILNNPYALMKSLGGVASEYSQSRINIIRRQLLGLPPEKLSKTHLTDEQFVDHWKGKFPDQFGLIDEAIYRAMNRGLAMKLGGKASGGRGIDVVQLLTPKGHEQLSKTGQIAVEDIGPRITMGSGNVLARLADPETKKFIGPVWKLGVAGTLAGAGMLAASREAKAESILPDPINEIMAEEDPLYVPELNLPKLPEQKIPTALHPAFKQVSEGIRNANAGKAASAEVIATLGLQGVANISPFIKSLIPRVNTPGLGKALDYVGDKLNQLNEKIVVNEMNADQPIVSPAAAALIKPGIGSQLAISAKMTPVDRALNRKHIFQKVAHAVTSPTYVAAADWYDQQNTSLERTTRMMEAAFPDMPIFPGTIAEQATWAIGYSALFKAANAGRLAISRGPLGEMEILGQTINKGRSWLDLYKSGEAARATWEAAMVGIPFDLMTGGSPGLSLVSNIGLPFMFMGALSRPVINASQKAFKEPLIKLWEHLSELGLKGLEYVPTTIHPKVPKIGGSQYIGQSGELNWRQLLEPASNRLRKTTPEGQQLIENVARDLSIIRQQGRELAEKIDVVAKDPAKNDMLKKMLETRREDWLERGIDLEGLPEQTREEMLDAYVHFDSMRKKVSLEASQKVQREVQGKQTIWLKKANQSMIDGEKGALDWLRSTDPEDEAIGLKFLGFRKAETQRRAVTEGMERHLPVFGYMDETNRRKVITLDDARNLKAVENGVVSPVVKEFTAIADKKGVKVEDLLDEVNRQGTPVQVTDSLKKMFLKWDTHMNNFDTYTSRIYQKHWNQLPEAIRLKYADYKASYDAAQKLSSMQMLAMSTARYRKLNNLPQELIDELDPIVDMATLSHAQYVTAKSDLMMSDAFRTLSADNKICMDESAMKALTASGRVKDIREVTLGPKILQPLQRGHTAVASVADEAGKVVHYIKVPDNVEKYGMLANKWLNQDAFFELETMVIPSQTGGLSQTALNWFKFGATVANPRTHMRNIYSNVILNHMGTEHGMSLYDPRAWLAYKDSVRILRNPEKYKQFMNEAIEDGLTIGTFTSSELKHLEPILRMKHQEGMLGLLEAGKYGVKKIGRKMASAYEMEEQWAKIAKYKYLRDVKGLSRKEAARSAMESTFNYNDVSPFIRRWRNSWVGAPFITFTYKAMPLIAKSLVQAPWRLLSLQMGMWAWQVGAMNAQGINFDQFEQLKAKLPASVAQGKYLLMPWKDSRGRMQWLDMTYILPWGDIYGLAGGAKEAMGPRLPGVGKIMLANPLFATAASLATNVGFNGKPIWNSEMDSIPTASSKALLSVAQSMIPAVMAPATDIYKVMREAKSGRTPAQALLAELGLKIMPLTASEVDRRWKGKLMKQQSLARKKAYGEIAQFGTTTDEKKNQQVRQEARKDYIEKLKEIRKEKERVENIRPSRKFKSAIGFGD